MATRRPNAGGAVAEGNTQPRGSDADVLYLSDLLNRFDSNLELALAAYNAGEEALERYGRHVPSRR